MLRYFSGYPSYEQIAAILSLPVGTVRSRLNQVKTRLACNWNEKKEGDERLLKESNEWNAFYNYTFSHMHKHDVPKSQFLQHLNKDIRVTFTNGKSAAGSFLIDNLIAEDRHAGSWFFPYNIQSVGNISIIETKHVNSPEHPFRCPESTVCILYRQKGKADRINVYNARR